MKHYHVDKYIPYESTERENGFGTEHLFKEIMAENFLNLWGQGMKQSAKCWVGEKTCQPRICYLAKLFFRTEGERKIFLCK